MATRYWVGGDGFWFDTAHWSTSSGGSGYASVPTSSDDAIFDSNSSSGGSLVVAFSSGYSCNNLTISNSNFFAPNPSETLYIYGSFTATTTFTIESSSVLFFRATSGTKTITSASGKLPVLSFIGAGGTWQLGSNVEVNTIVLAQGTFKSLGYNVKLGDGNASTATTVFSSSNSNTRTLDMGSGAWTVYGNWDCTTSTNLTLSHSGAIITMSSNRVSSVPIYDISFYGGGKSYPDLVHSVAASGQANQLTLYGSNTFTSITVTTSTSYAKTLRLESGTTTTISSALILTGASGKQITFNTTAGTQATLSAGAGTVAPATYTTISNSNAIGGATYYALASAGSVDGGNNTGWYFGTTSGGFLAFF